MTPFSQLRFLRLPLASSSPTCHARSLTLKVLRTRVPSYLNQSHSISTHRITTPLHLKSQNNRGFHNRLIFVQPTPTSVLLHLQQHSRTTPYCSSSQSSKPTTNTSTTKMSDEDYANFLDKANQDVSGSKSKDNTKPSKSGSSKKDIKLQTSSEPLPESLHNVEEHIYVSDADEPFESVNLALEKGQNDIDADTLSSLLNTKITKISQKDFDPRGSYDAVVTLVKKAGKGDVTFWQGERGGARVEYYVLTVLEAGGGKRVVGVRATSVES